MTARVSDDPDPKVHRTGACLRDCPTLPGDTRSLITHRIETDVCLERQRQQYHKCHRCQYRGKPAGYVVDAAVVLARVEELGIPIGFVDIPIPAAEAPPRKKRKDQGTSTTPG